MSDLKCGKCGENWPSGTKFCGSCGTAIVQTEVERKTVSYLGGTMNDCIIDDFDKFKNVRRRTSKYQVSFEPTSSNGLMVGGFGLFLHETEGSTSLNVQVYFQRDGWMFLDQGKFIFLAGGENITLSPDETHTDTVRGSGISELALYPITHDQLKTLCDAVSWEVQLSGGKHTEHLICNQHAIKIFRQFYNQIFDNSVYPESLTMPVAAPACFPSDARVLTPQGYRRVIDVVAGDLVIGYGEDGTLRTETVTRQLDHSATDILSIRFLDGKQPLRTTINHTLLTDRGWLRADKLKDGDCLSCVSGNRRMETRVVGSLVMEPAERVFNLHTTGAHNFVVEGVIAHNFTVLRTLRTWAHRLFVDPFFTTQSANGFGHLRPGARLESNHDES
jgi:hypothetical protein